MLDLDLGEAKEIGGKLICKDCLEEGVTVGAEPGGGNEGPGQDINEILAGLGRVEEVGEREEGAPESDLLPLGSGEPSEVPNGVTKAYPSPGRTKTKGPPPPPVDQEELDELLGEDFEEIDSGLPDGTPRVDPSPAKLSPASNAPSSLVPDEDLFEIGDTGLT